MDRFWGVVPDRWPSDSGVMRRCKSLESARQCAEQLAIRERCGYVVLESVACVRPSGVEWVDIDGDSSDLLQDCGEF